jgi:hypothetical protein
MCYAVLRSAVATLVDFHDGRRRTDADVVDINEVYDDALQWCFSDCGPMTFEYACLAVGVEPRRLRGLLSKLRSRLSFKQFIRYQKCLCCDSPEAVIGAHQGVFFYPICTKCLENQCEDGTSAARACMRLFREYREIHRNT